MLKPINFWGTGLYLYGYKPRGDGTFEVYLWITFFFLPLIPLSAWVIRPIAIKSLDAGTAYLESCSYDVVEKKKLDFADVIKSYFVGIAAIAPLCSVIYYFETIVRPITKGPMPQWLVCLFLLFAFWAFAVLLLSEKRKDKAYEGKPVINMLDNKPKK